MVRVHPDPPDHQHASREQAGAVAQLGEHLLCKQGVVGSIPISSTSILVTIIASSAARNAASRIQTQAAFESRLRLASCQIGCSLTIRKARRSRDLMRVPWTKRVELYLAFVRETKGAEGSGANTPVTGIHSYGVKRLSACDGCLGDYRR